MTKSWGRLPSPANFSDRSSSAIAFDPGAFQASAIDPSESPGCQAATEDTTGLYPLVSTSPRGRKPPGSLSERVRTPQGLEESPDDLGCRVAAERAREAVSSSRTPAIPRATRSRRSSPAPKRGSGRAVGHHRSFHSGNQGEGTCGKPCPREQDGPEHGRSPDGLERAGSAAWVMEYLNTSRSESVLSIDRSAFERTSCPQPARAGDGAMPTTTRST